MDMAMDWSTARGLLMLSPRLMLIPTFSMEDTVLDMLDMVDTMVVLDMDMAMDWSTARGLLMLSPRLMQIPTFSMEDMDMEVMALDTDMVLDTGDTTGDKRITVSRKVGNRSRSFRESTARITKKM